MSRCYIAAVLFKIRGTEKRTHALNVRLTEEEYEAVLWCVTQMTPEHGRLSPPDIARQGIARLYSELKDRAPRASPSRRKK